MYNKKEFYTKLKKRIEEKIGGNIANSREIINDNKALDMFAPYDGYRFCEAELYNFPFGYVGTIPEWESGELIDILSSKIVFCFRDLVNAFAMYMGRGVWMGNYEVLIKTRFFFEGIGAEMSPCTKQQLERTLCRFGIENSQAKKYATRIASGKGWGNDYEQLSHILPEWFLNSMNRIDLLVDEKDALQEAKWAISLAYCKNRWPELFYESYLEECVSPGIYGFKELAQADLNRSQEMVLELLIGGEKLDHKKRELYRAQWIVLELQMSGLIIDSVKKDADGKMKYKIINQDSKEKDNLSGELPFR